MGFADGGTTRRPATSATPTIGRLTMKIEPQAKCSRSHPPSVGPITTPRPATADHMAIALARSAGTVKTLVRMESVAGMIAAAPIPITTRQAMSSPAEVDMAARAEPSPKTTRPPARVRWRPMRSPRLPKREQQPGHGQGVGVDDPLQRSWSRRAGDAPTWAAPR